MASNSMKQCWSDNAGAKSVTICQAQNDYAITTVHVQIAKFKFCHIQNITISPYLMPAKFSCYMVMPIHTICHTIKACSASISVTLHYLHKALQGFVYSPPTIMFVMNQFVTSRLSLYTSGTLFACVTYHSVWGCHRRNVTTSKDAIKNATRTRTVLKRRSGFDRRTL